MRRKMIFVLLCGALVLAPTVWSQAANPDAAKRGAEILAEALKAAGGDAVKKIERIEFSSSGDVMSPMGTVLVDIKLKTSLPDRLRMETTVGEFGTFSQGFDGKDGWATSPQGPVDMPADYNPQAVRDIALIGGIGLLREVAAGKAQAEFAGEQEVEKRKTLVVEWNIPAGKVKLFIDAESKLLVAAKYRALTMQGAVEQERRWSDFRAVDGVQFPHHWVTYRDGSLYSDQSVKEVKFNTPMDAAVFAKPQ